MLDQESDEALVRAKRRAMNADWGFVDVVTVFVNQIQRRIFEPGGLAHPLRHPAEAAPPFAVFEGWELGISGAKLLQKDRSIRVQGNEIIYLTLGPWTKPVQILVKPPAHLVFG